jgi:FkbM family methyltransferase
MLLRLLLSAFRKQRPLPQQSTAASPAAGLSLEQYEALAPAVTITEGATDVTYCTPNMATRWRVDTLYTKEPDTIEWIRSFEAGDVFVDIGANVGMYSIFAAKVKGAMVYAFEPESQNYGLLYKNIVVNAVSDRITAYCAALTDEEKFSLLYLSNFHLGNSCHTFDAPLDPNLRNRESRYTQGCFSTTLDNLTGRGVLPVPTHIKIDVDGIEHKVLAGCRKTLGNRKVRSVLVEINTNLPEHRSIIGQMADLGFSYSTGQVNSSMRQDGPFKGVANHVFRR